MAVPSSNDRIALFAFVIFVAMAPAMGFADSSSLSSPTSGSVSADAAVAADTAAPAKPRAPMVRIDGLSGRPLSLRTSLLGATPPASGVLVGEGGGVGAGELARVERLRGIDGGDVGGYLSYVQPLDDLGRETVGVNMQVAEPTTDAYDLLLVQPGVEYQTPLTGSLQLNARVYSTFASDGMTTSFTSVGAGQDRGSGQTGLRDVGLGLGVGYSVTDRLGIQTEAGVAREFGSSEDSAQTSKPKSGNQFFGGVVIKYKF